MFRARLTYAIVWTLAVAFSGLLVSLASRLVEERRLSALESAKARAAFAADNAETSVNRFLLGIDVLLSSVDPVRDRPGLALKELARSHLAVRDLVIADADGNVLASAMPVTERLGLRLPDGLFASLLQSASPTLGISQSVESFATSEPVIYFARQLGHGPDAQLVSLAVVPTVHVVASLGAPQEGFTFMLERHDGELIVAAPQHGVPTSSWFSRAPDKAVHDGAADLARSPMEGKRAIVASRALVHPGLRVAVSVPQEKALESWLVYRRNVFISATFLGLLVLAGAALVHWTLRRMHLSNHEISSAKQWLDQAISSVAEGILLCDAGDRVVAWNDRYLGFYPWLKTVIRPGIPHEHLIRLSVLHLCASETDEQREALVRQRLAAQGHLGGQFEHHVSEDLIVQVTESRTPAGGTVSVFRDITATERELEAARRAEQMARSANQHFITSIRDELHDGALSLVGLLDRVRHVQPSIIQPSILDLIHCQAQQVVSGITDLHELHRLQSGVVHVKREPIDIASLVRRAAKHAEQLARVLSVRLDVVCMPSLPRHVVSDSGLLAQLVYSVLRVAVGAAPSGTNLRAIFCHEVGADAMGQPRLLLEMHCNGTDNANKLVHALKEGSKGTGRTSTALRLARRLAQTLGGEVVVIANRDAAAFPKVISMSMRSEAFHTDSTELVA